MNRRTFLEHGGMAVLGLGVSGCATRSAAARSARARRPPVNLPPVLASWDRVIRTTVGLRPHRPSGFVLRAERLDAKTIVHNYGHGGTGHSLGWGTGSLAADLALGHEARDAAVIGCGTVGLTAARELQRRGFTVTIYTASVPPDTTSNMALAGFTPTSGLVLPDRRTPEWEAQFRRAVEIAYRQLQLLAGRSYGVSWLDNYSLSNDPPSLAAGLASFGGTSLPGNRPREGALGVNDLLPAHLRIGEEVLQPGEHPFPVKYAIRRPAMRIEPSIYLDALLRDFLLFGGRIVIRRFDAPRDLMALSEPVIVNCTGLGSRALFNDQELMPVKGQLSVLIPQSEVDYRISGGGVSTMPRSDGIALGGTTERDVWTLEPNEEARQRIVGSAVKLFAGMSVAAAGARLTRSAPPATAPRVESFFAEES